MSRFASRQRRRPPTAFTLIEALVSISIAAIGGSVLLLGITTSLRATDETRDQTIAYGMAQQLMDEVLGERYHAPTVDGYQTVLGPSSYEQSGLGRERYDDIDDFRVVKTQPPEDRWGVELGKEDIDGNPRHPNFMAPSGLFAYWQQEVDVYYVDQSDLTTHLASGAVSDYRVVEVRIVSNHPDRGRRELARLQRVIAYVPALP